MKVEKISKEKNKVLIHFENKEQIGLSLEVFYLNRLELDTDYSEEFIDNIKNINDEILLKEYAFRLISKREYSVFSLKKKLFLRIPNDVAINRVINLFIERNYLNDYEFTKHFIDSKLRISKNGLVKIKLELKKQGIDDYIYEELIQNIDNQLQNDIALSLAKKKNQTIKHDDVLKRKGSIYRFLMSKGFENEIIIATLNKIF